MALSLIIDDTSLLLLLAIILLLAVGILLGKAYQPLVHPLILSRQADVAAVRHKGQSAVYRNANAPAGFELSSQPRRAIATVRDIVAHGTGTFKSDAKRSLYGTPCSNDDVRETAVKFSRGLASLIGVDANELALAVCVEVDSQSSLAATLSGDVCATATQRCAPLIVAPAHLHADASPSHLPGSLAEHLHAILTTPVVFSQAKEMAIVSNKTLFIVDADDVEELQKSTEGTVISFRDVIRQGSTYSASAAAAVGKEKIDEHEASRAIHSYFWAGRHAGWVGVTNASLVAGVTAHLGFYPADAQPSTADHIYVEQSPYIASPSLRLAAASTPAGLVLALLSLYTGAALSASTISDTHADPSPAASSDFASADPTLLFSSAAGASSLAACLCAVTRRSPLARLGAHTKTAALRHGTLGKTGMWDALLFTRTRQHIGCTRLRSLMIVAEGPTVGQSLLDVLRIQLGCPVRLSYLPSQAMRVFGTGVDAGVMAASDESSPSYALPTAPLTAVHSLDLQAFAAEKARKTKRRAVAAHLGPPNVSVELKLVESALAKSSGLSVFGVADDAGRAHDPNGEVFVRGTAITTSNSEQWCATGELGTLRSNGTLVILQDRAGSTEVDVPTLSSEYPFSSRTSRIGAGGHPTRIITALCVMLCICCCCCSGVDAAGVDATRLARRADSSPNTTFVETSIMSFMNAQRASWEQGVAQSAMLEYYAGEWSVFAGRNAPPYLRSGGGSGSSAMPNALQAMAYAAVASQDRTGQLCSRVTGDESASDGSALDPAACGEAVLLGAYANGQLSNNQLSASGNFASAAQRQLAYLLNTAPRNPSGAISMRAVGEAYWSDGVYMGPPFLALYGLMTRNQSLLQASYDQVRLYRDALRIPSGPAQGLFRHIVNASNPTASNNDDGAWLTGNAWSAAGMCRVLASIAQSEYASSMSSQISDLVAWTQEIVSTALAQGTPLMHNYVNDTSTFQDAGGSAMIAYAAYRLASMAPNGNYSAQLATANAIYAAVQSRIAPNGRLLAGTNVVDPLVFTTPSQASPESMAFMVLMSAARRDHAQGNVTGLSGPGSGASAAAHRFVSTAAWLSVALAALTSAVLL